MSTDFDPESGHRLSPVKPEGLDDDAKKIYDHFVDPGSTTYVGIWGPGGIRLHSPEVAKHTQSMNDYIRYEAGIDPRLREIAILVVARSLDSQFEWCAHIKPALKQGVSQELIDRIHDNGSLEGVDKIDAMVIQLGREIFSGPVVTKDTYDRALDHFGAKGLVDFVTLMAGYAGTAALLKTFNMQLKPDWEPSLEIRD
jgi:4-carboxymuconolactone decarboxylase